MRLLAIGLIAATPLLLALPTATAIQTSWAIPNAEEWLTGYLTSNGGQNGISWDPHAPSEDDLGPPPDTLRPYLKQLNPWVPLNHPGSGVDLQPHHAEEFTSEPLPFTLHLNANRAIQLELYYKKTNCAGSPGGCCKGNNIWAIELHADTTLVAGQWGYSQGTPKAVVKTSNTHDICPLSMAPEVGTLPAGTVLRLRIFHIQDRYNDVRWGLAGDHRSRIELPFFPEYEWIFRDPATNADGAAGGSVVKRGPSPAPGSAMAMGMAVPLVPLGSRPARARRLALALVFTAVASGCLAGGGPASGEADPNLRAGSARQTLIPQATSGALGGQNGSIVGVVYDDLKVPLVDVHVSLAELANFTKTDKNGRFLFSVVPPGAFNLHFTKPSYDVFETTATVRSGFVTRIEVALAPNFVPDDTNLRPHRHDYWGQAPQITLMDADVQNPATNTFCQKAAGQGVMCPDSSNYQVPFSIPRPSKPGDFNSILPGTHEIVVSLGITPTNYAYSRVGLEFRSNADLDANNWSVLYPRALPAQFRIPTTWEMADPAHQAWSSWKFSTYVVPEDCVQIAVCGNPTAATVGPTFSFHVKVEIRKGVVPLEPAHPDYWQGNQTVTIIDDYPTIKRGQGDPASAALAPAYCKVYADSSPDYDYRYCMGAFFGPASRITPMEAAWLEVYLNQTEAFNPAYDWELYYHAADNPNPESPYGCTYNANTGGKNTRAPTPVETKPLSTLWRIPLKTGEADPAYAKVTGWGCWLARPSDPEKAMQNQMDPLKGNLPLHVVVIAHRDLMPAA